jgi:hypothetical protein
MADRYWVGGSGTWDGSNTTNWSTTSGGAGGASVPTAADNVIFNANSNIGVSTFTVTMATTPRVCNDFLATGIDATMTLAGTNIGLTVSGSLTFVNMIVSYTGTTTFNATTTGKTVTTNGIAFAGDVTFNGIGGAWTLGSALSLAGGTITVTNGTFDTSSVGNYAVTANTLSSTSTTTTRIINLNNSTVTLGGVTTINFGVAATFTFNAGTSTINLSSSAIIFAGANKTFRNVVATSTAGSSLTINGANTFTSIVTTARTSAGILQISFGADQTIGTLTLNNAGNGAFRTMLLSSVIGTARTLTVTTFTATTDVDFRDIVAAGASGTWSGSRFGNCNGNTNITFDAAKTVYWRATAGGGWGASGSGSWSNAIGGTAISIYFPLPQDTAIFPASTYPASGSTITLNASYNIGTLDMSLRTANTITWSNSTSNPNIYGNWISGTGVTQSGTGTNIFAGRTTQQITSAGVAFTGSINVNCFGGSLTLQDDLTISATQSFNHTGGTLNLQSFTLNAGTFTSSGTATRTLAFGTGQINCTGSNTTVYNTSSSTNLTVTGSKTVNITSTGSAPISVLPSANTIGETQNLNFIGGTYALTAPTFTVGNVDFTGYAGTFTPSIGSSFIYGNLTLSTGMTLGASVGTIFFFSQGTQLITSNGRTFNTNLTFQHAPTTNSSRLQDALTTSSAYYVTHQQGNINLNNFTLSTGVFITNSSVTRSIAFGTGNITCTSTVNNNYLFRMETGYANFTYTGTPTVNLSSVATVGTTLALGAPNNSSANVQLNYNVTSGSYTLQAPYANSNGQSCYAGSLNFTGFNGTNGLSGFWNLSRDLIFSPTMTLSFVLSSYYIYLFPSAGQTSNVQTNGLTIQYPMYFAGVGTGNIKLLDAIFVNQNTFFYSGKLDLNGKTFTGTFTINNFAFEITFNGGTIVVGGSITNGIGTNLTTVAGTGTGTISMNNASAKSFNGGGATFNCTLNQGGAGALTITGSNTFSNITNTRKSTSAASILFTAGTTNTFTNWNASGEATRLLTIGSVTAASHTLSKSSGTVSANYLSISRSTATGGAFWYAGANSTDGGNNTGWIFSAAPTFESRFLLFF